MVSRVEYRDEDDEEIQHHTHNRQVTRFTVEREPILDQCQQMVHSIMRRTIKPLIQARLYYNNDVERITRYSLVLASQRGREGFQSDKYCRFQKNFQQAIFIASLLENLQTGIKPALDFLQMSLEQVPLLRSLQYDTEVQQLQSILTNMVKNHAEHPKIRKLKSILEDRFDGKKQAGQVIVFASYRETVKDIVQVLNESAGGLISARQFIGQSGGKKNNKGMSQKEQKRILQGFREQVFNVLVATCIGEEGLDIPEVELIICFDGSASPIRDIQRMGRTGRHGCGEVIYLIYDEGKDGEKYKRNRDEVKRISSILRNADSHLELYDSAPRMIPRELTPKMLLTDMATNIPEDIQRTSQHRAKRPSLGKKAPQRLQRPDHSISTRDVGHSASGSADHQRNSFSKWSLDREQPETGGPEKENSNNPIQVTTFAPPSLSSCIRLTRNENPRLNDAPQHSSPQKPVKDDSERQGGVAAILESFQAPENNDQELLADICPERAMQSFSPSELGECVQNSSRKESLSTEQQQQPILNGSGIKRPREDSHQNPFLIDLTARATQNQIEECCLLTQLDEAQDMSFWNQKNCQSPERTPAEKKICTNPGNVSINQDSPIWSIRRSLSSGNIQNRCDPDCGPSQLDTTQDDLRWKGRKRNRPVICDDTSTDGSCGYNSAASSENDIPSSQHPIRGNKDIVEAAFIDFEAQASEGEGAGDDVEDDDYVTPGGSQHGFIDNATQPALMTQVTPGMVPDMMAVYHRSLNAAQQPTQDFVKRLEERIQNAAEQSELIDDDASQDPVEEHTQSYDGECQLCGGGGLLVLCDECNGGFHLHCVGLSEAPEGTWICEICKVEANFPNL